MARQHNTKETKELIISSAVENFIEKGYAKTTLEDIVKKVGLTRGAFYWNFQSKKELLDEVVCRYENFYLEIYNSVEHYDSAYKTVRDFLTKNLKKKNHPNPYVTIIRYKVETGEEVSDIIDRQKALDDHFLSIIKSEIRRGQEQGEFITSTDAGLLTTMVYSFLLGFDTYNSVHFADNKDSFFSDSEIETFVDFILKKITV